MKTLCCVAVIVCLGLLTGCANGDGEGAATGKAPKPATPTNATTTEHKPQAKGPRVLEITLDGYPNPDYAGLFLAQQRGYFKDAGLEVLVHTPILPVKPIPYVIEGSVEISVSHEPEVILAGEQGVPVVAVGAVLRQPTTSLVWLRNSAIRGIGDLKGKTIATEGLEYQERFLEALLTEEGLTLDDVKVLKRGYGLVKALKNGRVDAIIGVGWNVEGPQLRAEGFDPVVLPVADRSIGDYDELVVVARRDRLAQIGDMVQDFMGALARGNRAVRTDPGSAARAIATENPELPPKAIAKGIQETLPLLSKSGYLDPNQWERFAQRMQASGIAEDPPPAAQLITDEYVR